MLLSTLVGAKEPTLGVGPQQSNKSSADPMKSPILSLVPDRRSLLKAAAAMGALQVASPFVIRVRAAENIKIGMVDPLTGVYAAPAGNEVMGANSP